jgi:gamma-glutamyltranspeptidase/glutathione hydrolase
MSTMTTKKKVSSLSPAHWSEAERQQFLELEHGWGQSKPLAQGGKGMVVGHTGAVAIRAGIEVLRQGSSAMDAAVTTALAQVALAAGCFISYAGTMNLAYYEAATGKVHTLDAGYGVPRAETDPLSIPSPPTPSGRTALVPGFIAGLEAAHRRFGKLPFASLFEPAIFLADEGFEIRYIARAIRYRKDVLGRLAGTRDIFTGENGEFYQEGEHFRQPELARTLRAVANQGVEYMYTGPWAHAFVKLAEQEGGRITLDDLERYSPEWTVPTCSHYHGHEVYGPLGRQWMFEALNLLELADLQQYGHYTDSPESLYWFIQMARISQLISDMPDDLLQEEFPHLSPWPSGWNAHVPARLTSEHTQAVWEKLRTPGWIQSITPQVYPATLGGGHSDGVVAIDAQGNVAAVSHTICSSAWGWTGLFVGGVGIPDSGGIIQSDMKRVGPGGRAPNGMNPLIVLKGGKPVLACTAVGDAIVEVTLQCVQNVLDYGMDPRAANETPHFYRQVSTADTDGKYSQFHKHWVQENAFSEALLQDVQERGQPVVQATGSDPGGWWQGIAIDAESGERWGGTSRANGYALNE